MNRCTPGVKNRAGSAAWLKFLPSDGPATGQAEEISEPECILLALAQAVEQRDIQTAGHCERLAMVAVAIGIAMRLPRANLMALYRGGYLHDIGKVGMPDSILFKPGPLTASEWVTMRSHTIRGEEICRPMKSLAPVLPIIRHHHERWDGSGYPDGLRGQQIPLLARVLQVADIYDALTSPRPYKRAFSPNEALQIMSLETERGWRDPDIMALFVRLHGDVISRLTAYDCDTDPDLKIMRSSMLNLQRFVEVDSTAPALHPEPQAAPFGCNPSPG